MANEEQISILKQGLRYGIVGEMTIIQRCFCNLPTSVTRGSEG
jgi:hypothetical protein